MEVKPSAQKVSLHLCPYSLLPFVIIGALVLLYLPSFSGLVNRWTQWDEALAHGLPVAAIFLYLLYKSGPWPVASYSNLVTLIGCCAIVLLSLCWLVFHAIQITLLAQLILLPLLITALFPLFGWQKLMQQRHLLLLLVFVLPAWDYLNEPLLRLSSLVVGEMVRLIKMPALIEGSSIYIPYGHIIIADGCSGLRYFVISLALGYLIGYFNGYREKGMLALLAVAALLGLLANWIRIFLLIIIGYQTEMQSTLMQEHETFGWILFAVIVLPAIYFAPVIRHAGSAPVEVNKADFPLKRLLVVLCALATGPAVALAVDLSPRATGSVNLYHASAELNESRESMPVSVRAPAAGVTLHYQLPGTPLHIQLNQYRRNTTDDKLVPYLHRLYDAEQWSLVEANKVTLTDKTVGLQLLRQKGGTQQVAQVQWFDTGGYLGASVMSAKLLQIPAVLFGDNYFAIVTLQAQCRLGDCSHAIELLKINAQQLYLSQE